MSIPSQYETLKQWIDDIVAKNNNAFNEFLFLYKNWDKLSEEGVVAIQTDIINNIQYTIENLNLIRDEINGLGYKIKAEDKLDDKINA